MSAHQASGVIESLRTDWQGAPKATCLVPVRVNGYKDEMNLLLTIDGTGLVLGQLVTLTIEYLIPADDI